MELNKKGLSWTSSEEGETRSGKKRGDALGRNSFYLFSSRLKEFLLFKTPLKTCMSAEEWSEAVCKEDGWKQRQESWGPMGSAGGARAASRSVGNTLGRGAGKGGVPSRWSSACVTVLTKLLKTCMRHWLCKKLDLSVWLKDKLWGTRSVNRVIQSFAMFKEIYQDFSFLGPVI